ncbi:Polynucleotidyl transferase, ribonuclease H-like superfamily protein, partial [Prunus dulcis]
RATITTISQPLLECFRSIQYSDAPAKILDNEFLKHFVKVFGLDLETTGLSRKEGRIVEIAVRDLHGGKNSCFQTLVNPEQHVPNSHIHGIGVTFRCPKALQEVIMMAELIPILVLSNTSKAAKYPEGNVILAAHNARCFDVPFLLKEFRCCSFDVPPDWLFLDTLALARELRKLHGSRALPKISLQGLREFYRIPLEGSNHRAMSDVNVLSSILPNMTFDLKLGVDDLLRRTFKASACNITRTRT